MKKTALTIAGSDSSGGAGVQADIKTLEANGVYAMSVITALTAQNTCGVQDVLEVPPEFFRRQLESVLKDILPAAVKIGMLYTKEIVEETAVLLKSMISGRLLWTLSWYPPVVGACYGRTQKKLCRSRYFRWQGY